MKNKILETEVSASLETIARALRDYSGDGLTCHLFVETREKKPEFGTDFYAFEVRKDDEVLLELGRRIAYCWDDDNGGNEIIRETYNCFGGCDDGTD